MRTSTFTAMVLDALLSGGLTGTAADEAAADRTGKDKRAPHGNRLSRSVRPSGPTLAFVRGGEFDSPPLTGRATL